MESPPSGWYPDPYGVPGLLRWWDGSTWTQHTHADATDNAAAATSVQPAGLQSTMVQPTGLQPTTVQPGVQQTTIQPSVQPTAVQPSAQPTMRQPAVQPTAVQPAVQPTAVQPADVQGAGARQVFTPPRGPDDNGTQVLFLGDDAWTTPGTPGDPGGPGGPGQGSRYGYYRAQRRRRIWLMSGLAAGTAVALGLIALVVTSLGSSPAALVASKTPTASAAVTTPPPSPTPSPTPSATPPPRLTDGVSGLSYTQLASPWQPTCPSSLNNQAFNWSAGESAIAGQVNGGQTAWYGTACSGPLPQSYGYNGVADLANVTTNLVNTFNGTYYSALQHTIQNELNQPLTVSGHPGWEIKFLISYTNVQGQGLPFTEEQGAVVVADLGTATPAVFYVSVPSNLGESNVDSLVSSLRLTTPAQPGGGGSPGDGSPAAGSPGPGDGNGNGHGHGN